jgi:osmotically-inducible protein OsmY
MKTIPTLTTAAAAMVLLLSPALTSCNREPVERTAAEQQDDQKLSDAVKATFATSPSFKFPDVQVASYRGTVQLSGFVVSDDQKKAAENLAKGVPGVQAVENKISLKR